MSSKPAKVTLLDLQPEILTHILLYVPFTSVVNCKGVNRHLQCLISGSIELQYYIHLNIFGQRDNPLCGLPVSERLDQLLTRERRLEVFDFKFEKFIDVPVLAEYNQRRLSRGILSLSYPDGVFREMQVPSEVDQEVKWTEARAEHALAAAPMHIYEQDLRVLVVQRRTTYASGAQPRTIHEVQIHLNRSSTGEPHPDAQRAITFKTHEEFGEPRVSIGCAGGNLVLVLRDCVETHEPDDQVYVYGWKTGELKMRISAPFNSYRFPLFLTMHVFLLANAKTGELEYWRIPRILSESPSDQPFFILALPRLSSGKVFHEIFCRATPHLSYGPQNASNPFYTDPHHAIVVSDVVIQSADRAGDATHFMFFVHRSSLVGYLDIFSTFISPNKRPMPVPYDDWGPSACRWFDDSMDGHETWWLSGTFGQRYAPGIVGASPLILFNFNPIDVGKVLATKSHTPNVEMEDGGHQDTDGGYKDIEGDWFEDNGKQLQRYAEKGREVLSQLHGSSASRLLFDPSANESETGSSSSQPRSRTKVVTRALDPLDDPGRCFENTVYSALPYTVRSSQDSLCDFEDLFLQEEYILGTQTAGSWDLIKQVHVLHYG
ncbi:hypothetical protein P691DRAFT_759122 [Macrolepiota fuliginosa MF-IS2]|uniref:F-box domain-containing protein n=1 Tax=Macrolepiota fuliginosa MF-IS2 TaxID=1400762 RepID=A0A9P6C2U4_9AGAR|nr:hypothetical protein P691DRAFT_759122 [Macrolepiota fuliginosa MF-IS2]